MQMPARQAQRPPPGESLSCSSAQWMACPTRKLSTPFVTLFIALSHSRWKRWFYPTSSIFRAKQATMNASCHCWGLCVLYVWRHEPWLKVTISSDYGTVLHRRLCFSYSPNSAVDKHLRSAALWSQQVQTFRRPPCITQHLSYSTVLNTKVIWEAGHKHPTERHVLL